MKKILGVTLSVLLLSLSVSACSELGEDETTADSQSAAASGETTLVFAENEEKSSDIAEAGATEESTAQQVAAEPEEAQS